MHEVTSSSILPSRVSNMCSAKKTLMKIHMVVLAENSKFINGDAGGIEPNLPKIIYSKLVTKQKCKSLTSKMGK